MIDAQAVCALFIRFLFAYYSWYCVQIKVVRSRRDSSRLAEFASYRLRFVTCFPFFIRIAADWCAIPLKKKRSPFETKALGSSQGTPPSSPATMSAFSRAVGAATTMVNKQVPNQTQTQTQTQTLTQAQIQSTGNPLGIAAVLLQGAQGKFRIYAPWFLGRIESSNLNFSSFKLRLWCLGEFFKIIPEIKIYICIHI